LSSDELDFATLKLGLLNHVIRPAPATVIAEYPRKFLRFM
jgi:hypothetical protein